jgi:Na+-translocating ferredoxin:NAD+ oxidoreductase RnfC subunit
MSLPDELYNMKFAEYFDSMRRMYLQDEKFKEICDHYCSNIAEVKMYRKKKEINFSKEQQCENLSKELEEEILFYLVRKS